MNITMHKQHFTTDFFQSLRAEEKLEFMHLRAEYPDYSFLNRNQFIALFLPGLLVWHETGELFDPTNPASYKRPTVNYRQRD